MVVFGLFSILGLAIPVVLNSALIAIALLILRRVDPPVSAVLAVTGAVNLVLSCAFPASTLLLTTNGDGAVLAVVTLGAWLFWMLLTVTAVLVALGRLGIALIHAKGEHFWTREPTTDPASPL